MQASAYVEADFYQHVSRPPWSRAANVRMAIIMDYALDKCPEYVALRQKFSDMTYHEIHDAIVDIHGRNVHLLEWDDEDLSEDEGGVTE